MAVNTVRMPSLARVIAAELSKLGLDVPMIATGSGEAIPQNRYRYKELFDTQTIATAADTNTAFFNTSTSSRAAHGRKEAGCNLTTIGQNELNSDFFVLGISVDYLSGIDGDDDTSDDFTKLREYGIIRSVNVNEQKQLDELLFSAIPANRGMSHQGGRTGLASAAFAFDSIANGAPGQAWPMLPAPSRIYITGGEKIEVLACHQAAAALASARTVRITLHGIEIEARGASV